MKKNSRLGKSARKLLAFDRRSKITKLAHEIANALGYPTSNVFDDLGRTLVHYAPIHRLLEKFSRGNFRGKTILHLGASTGLYTMFLQEKGARAIALDINQAANEIAKRIGNRNIVRANAQLSKSLKELAPRFLPFKSNSMNAVVSDHFLFSGYTEVDDIKGRSIDHSTSLLVMVELYRILKPGGIAVLNFRVDSFGKEKDVKQIEKMGFKVIRPKKPLKWLPNYFWDNPQQEKMAILVCRKKRQ